MGEVEKVTFGSVDNNVYTVIFYIHIVLFLSFSPSQCIASKFGYSNNH